MTNLVTLKLLFLEIYYPPRQIQKLTSEFFPSSVGLFLLLLLPSSSFFLLLLLLPPPSSFLPRLPRLPRLPLLPCFPSLPRPRYLASLASLASLPSLTSLFLSNNNMTRIAKEFFDLKKFTYLPPPLPDLNALSLPPPSSVASLPSPSLTPLPDLNTLVLSNNNMTRIPKEFFDLKNLTALSIIENSKFSELPLEISKLSNLLDLELRSNYLTIIPFRWMRALPRYEEGGGRKEEGGGRSEEDGGGRDLKFIVIFQKWICLQTLFRSCQTSGRILKTWFL
jgi:Leucine-rich repeat (LRR) protein